MNSLRSSGKRRWGYLGSALDHRRRLTRLSRTGELQSCEPTPCCTIVVQKGDIVRDAERNQIGTSWDLNFAQMLLPLSHWGRGREAADKHGVDSVEAFSLLMVVPCVGVVPCVCVCVWGGGGGGGCTTCVWGEGGLYHVCVGGGGGVVPRVCGGRGGCTACVGGGGLNFEL